MANYVVHLDLPWNPAQLDQRTARAHRLGQTRGVSVTYLCAESGIERGIEGTLAGKRAVRAAALELTSDVEELENQSFSVFLRQLRTVIEELAPPNEGILPGETGDPLEPPPPWAADLERQPEPPVDTPAPQAHVAAPTVPLPVPVSVLVPVPATPPSIQAPPQGNGQPPRPSPGHRAHDRLRLAHVVLEAGFPGDAVKAAYEALAAGIATLIPDGPSPNHDALVASIYRDLVPAGKLGLAVPGILARLHDLGSLERMGVAVDPTLASDALAEVGDWVGRF